MSIDSLSSRVVDYKEKKDELDSDFEIYESEMKSLHKLEGMVDLSDEKVAECMSSMKSDFYQLERDLNERKDSLNTEKEELASDIQSFKKEVKVGESKLETIQDIKYGDSNKVTLDKFKDREANLQKLLDELNGTGDDDSLNANTIVKENDCKFRTDDYGNKHMERNEEGVYVPMKNITYTSNGYHYTTDDKGRIVHVEGVLMLSKASRKSLNANVPDMEAGDQRGHIIADMFGGSNMNDNLVAQLGKLNQKRYKNIEMKLANILAEDKNPPNRVFSQVEIKYDDDTRRPNSFVIKYKINDGPVQSSDVLSNVKEDYE